MKQRRGYRLAHGPTALLETSAAILTLNFGSHPGRFRAGRPHHVVQKPL